MDGSDAVSTVAERHWDDPLLYDPVAGDSWTYGDALVGAASLSQWLDAADPAWPTEVPLAPTNGPLAFVGFLGVVLSGRTALAIDPSSGQGDIDALLDRSASTALLTDAEALLDRNDATDLGDAPMDTADRADAMRLVAEMDAEVPSLVTFTSGTTGDPKGVVHSLGNLVRAAQSFGNRFEFGPDDTFLHCFPAAYMAGILNGCVVPFVHGSSVVLGPRASPRTVPGMLDTATDYGVSVFWFAPTVLAMLQKLNDGPYEGPADAVGCVATEPLPEDVRREFVSAFEIPLYESYGLSETLFLTTEYPGCDCVGEGVGEPLEGVSISVESDGEIFATAPWLFHGYRSRDVEFDRGRGYPTGDVGSLSGDVLRVTGRNDDLIVKGGVNISPRRIERVVEDVDGVSDVGVVGIPHDTVGEQVACAVVTDGESLPEPDIQAAVREELGSAYRIDEFQAVSSLPRTETGAVDSDRVRDRLTTARD